MVDGVLGGGSRRLSDFRGEIEDDRTSMAPRFEGFKAAVEGEAANRSWFR